jgi:hypothetical protein
MVTQMPVEKTNPGRAYQQLINRVLTIASPDKNRTWRLDICSPTADGQSGRQGERHKHPVGQAFLPAK